nr:Multidrug resistance-associated protein 1 [Polyrhizophydium stewartii]
MYSAGRISSIVGADKEDLKFAGAVFVEFILAVSQIVLALYFLVVYLGNAAWAALATFAAIMVTRLKFSTLFGKAWEGYVVYLDKRSKLLREFLQGIKIVKFQALEDAFFDRLEKLRVEQLRSVRLDSRTLFGNYVCIVMQTYLVPIVAVSVYATLKGSQISASDVFTAIALIQTLTGASNSLNSSMMGISILPISYRRVVDFFMAEELPPNQLTARRTLGEAPGGMAIKTNAASFSWEEVRLDQDAPVKAKGLFARKSNESVKSAKCKPSVDSIATELENKESGETVTQSNVPSSSDTLFSAQPDAKPAPFALQDITLDIPRGSLVAVVGSVGSGKSSLLSALIGGMRKTVGESALFGSVAYCAQEPWIMSGTIEENIVFGDDSVRARIPDAVTAACLDHDLEMLSNGLGTQIGEKGINLSGGQKARVALARAIARDADIYLLDDPIAALDAHVGKKVFDDAICGVLRGKTVILVTHQLHLLPKVDMVVVINEGRVVETGAFRELMARDGGSLFKIMKDYHFDDLDAEDETVKTDKLREEEKADECELIKAVKAFEEEKAIAEDRNVGAVGLSVIKSYFTASGNWFIPAIATSFFVLVLCNAATNIFLTLWSDSDQASPRFKLSLSFAQYRNLYICLGIIDLMVQSVFYAVVILCAYRPVGRVMHRMMYDVKSLDNGMHANLIIIGYRATLFIANLILVVYSSPWFIILFVILVICGISIFRVFQSSYREFKRLTVIRYTPLSAFVSESLYGMPTIVAYGVQKTFTIRQQYLSDRSNASWLHQIGAECWLNMRLELLASLVSFAVSMAGALGVLQSTTLALALFACVGLGATMNRLLYIAGTAEASFNAVERLNHYAYELEAEAARELPTDPKDGDWPTAGAVTIRDLEIRYPSRPDHAVIQDLSLDIQPGEKVGVVGRTGSGKSTLMTALFRIMEASKGSIAIDGIDIASLGLKTLRSRLQIIPQDPVLFRGTVRSNLDFATKHADDDLWAALDLVGLKDFVGSLDGKLDAAIEENGANLSMGQRQLMCLCKAILAKPKVLIMDEATASVDAEADKRIQESIETQFAATTVLSIAHRLNTIAAFDRVLVLDGGRIAEFDAPHVLLGRAGSVFGDMVEATGAANAAVIRQIAADHYAKKR